MTQQEREPAQEDFGWSGESRVMRAGCFVACIPSGGSLLAKVYGIASLQTAALAVALPCCAVLVGVWLWARQSNRRQLAAVLTLGFVGGLLGTFGYDLVRVPAHLGGQRIFAPISAYGIWIADAKLSSRFTDVIGWAYHFSNGITFGIMYALFMRGRHWAWAVLWALTLETIAVTSPFARIFSLSGSAIANAYLAHVAYGVPLGLVVERWDDTFRYLARIPRALKWTAAGLGCAAFAWPLLAPGNVRRDSRAAVGVFRVEGNQLNPDWLRIERGEAIQINNPGHERIAVVVRKSNLDEVVPIAGESTIPVTFEKTGIHQLFVAGGARSHSSFVITEPVEDVE